MNSIPTTFLAITLLSSTTLSSHTTIQALDKQKPSSPSQALALQECSARSLDARKEGSLHCG